MKAFLLVILSLFVMKTLCVLNFGPGQEDLMKKFKD